MSNEHDRLVPRVDRTYGQVSLIVHAGQAKHDCDQRRNGHQSNIKQHPKTATVDKLSAHGPVTQDVDDNVIR
eukprot:CAMPEP_0182594506 /NCGR_PEP_ID=MMETSP1324-20130603/80270_1 /TAXON_ID=236786 /ORGANISM="Florenciella sp., Strain RCC1587" /LENGTH=71 /DNA_ID=CAMNT_0024812055 /DNA_START=82 /DNA_END=294 /DNA_ORIENTATION=-